MLQQFIDALDSAIEVNRFDVPSTSSSPTQLIHYRFSRHAWLVSKMLNQLDYQQVDVPGVSWGGALAQQFAFQYSRRCWRLIMVSTATGAFMVPGELLRAFVGHPRVVYAVAWSPSGDEVVSDGSDGMLRWWNVHSRECVRMRLAHRGTIWLLRRSPDGSRLASCGDDEAITLWDLHSGEHLRTLRRDRPYERNNITRIRGLTQAQKATLSARNTVTTG